MTTVAAQTSLLPVAETRRPSPAMATKSERAVCAKVGPFHIEVRGTHPNAVDDFATLYAHALVETPATANVIRLHITETQASRVLRRRRFAIGCGDETIFEDLRSHEVFAYLEWAANYRVIANCARFVLLHAATLSWKGRGIMLVGQSGAGKSTLAAALVARGAEYLCDEFAMIDPETLELHPYPKALCVKAGSFPIVRRLGLPLWRRRCHVKAFKGRVGYIAPADLRPATAPVPIDLVIFPRFTGRADVQAYPCPPAQAAFTLAAAVLNGHHAMERAVDVAGRIAGRAACHTIEAGEITATAELVGDLTAR